MPDVAIVVSDRQDASRPELAATLAHELGLQGVPAAVAPGRFPPPRADLVTVLIDPLGYVAAEGDDALPGEAELRRTVFVCPDGVPTGGEEDPEIMLLARAGAVFALDRHDVATLHRAGIAARLMRPGYTESRDHYDAAAQRTIDVMVLGARTPRRAELLRRAAPVLARRNCLISLWEPGVHPRPGPGYPGEERWPLLARTKVLINLHGDERDARLEWSAVLDAIHAGAVVVSEHSTGLAPLDVGAHLLVASADAVPYVADRLLNDPDRLARMREQAYERLSTWIPFALPVSILRAAIVELVGEPIGDAATEVTPAPPVPSASVATGGPQPVARASHPVAVPPAAAVADSPAWAAHPAPRVSAVCVVDDPGAESLAATLDSVAAARLRELELIVVHASGGAAEAAAIRWCQAHPRIPSRRIALSGAPSAEAAQRAGALVARAPYTLLLDAGQAVYPRALEVLAGTLDDLDRARFAYPILEGRDDGSAPLLNTAGDPPRLPLMVRTAALVDDGDAALTDLVNAALVPQILGRVDER